LSVILSALVLKFPLKVALQTFRYFDTGKNPSEEEPERFYHSFSAEKRYLLAVRPLHRAAFGKKEIRRDIMRLRIYLYT
jgi:hypothetical protein